MKKRLHYNWLFAGMVHAVYLTHNHMNCAAFANVCFHVKVTSLLLQWKIMQRSSALKFRSWQITHGAEPLVFGQSEVGPLSAVVSQTCLVLFAVWCMQCLQARDIKKSIAMDAVPNDTCRKIEPEVDSFVRKAIADYRFIIASAKMGGPSIPSLAAKVDATAEGQTCNKRPGSQTVQCKRQFVVHCSEQKTEVQCQGSTPPSNVTSDSFCWMLKYQSPSTHLSHSSVFVCVDRSILKCRQVPVGSREVPSWVVNWSFWTFNKQNNGGKHYQNKTFTSGSTVFIEFEKLLW